MIPVSLTIEGLYSYRERQTIDFETLTSGQLFGIFGGVGSGKSSILEAMMFVLYDRSPRLSARGDNRYYNMLNLQSDALYIDFTFEAGRQNSETYRFTFSAQRKKSDYDTVEVKERGYYIRKDEDWQPLPDKVDAAEIVGMSYEHFMQTIIIPQGRFREFIDQPPKDRTKMLQELFQLDRFDLGEPANRLVSRTKDELLVLTTQLEGLDEVGEEELQAGLEAITHMKEKRVDMRQHLLERQEKLKACEQLKALYDSLAQYREELAKLENQKPAYQRRREALQRYELAVAQFRDKLDGFAQLEADLVKQRNDYSRLEKEVASGKARAAESKTAYDEAEKAYENRDALRQKLEDLELIIEIGEENRKGAQLAETLKKQEADSESLQKRLEDMRAALDATRQAQAELDEGPDSEAEILAALNTKRMQAQHSQQTERLKELLATEALRIEEQQGQLTHLIKSHGLEVPETASVKELHAYLDKQVAEVEQAMTALNGERNALQVKNKLSEWAEGLEEGEACPLCGATHHPNIANVEAVHSELTTIETREQKLKTKRNTYADLRTQVTAIEATLAATQQSKDSREKELATHMAQTLPEVAAAYADTTEAELAHQLEQAKAVRQKRQALSKQRDELEANLEAIRSKLDSEERNCQESRSEQKVVQAAIADKKQRVKQLPVEKFIDQPAQKLKESAERGRRQIADLERNYTEKKEALDRANQHYYQKEATYEALGKQVNDTEGRRRERQQQLSNLATEHAFGSIQEITDLLRTQLNVQGEKEAMTAFDKQLHSLGEQVKSCEDSIGGQTYEAEEHQGVAKEVAELTESLNSLEKELAVAEKERLRLMDQMEKKQALLKKKEALDIRLGNLKEIAGLFKGIGFVRYVSSIRLRDLCRAANERFFKLTKNNLSLELNDQNDFIVRDYLNNGRTRLLKTLSGGQTFQAALCLALALAENIRSLNEADQSFFFLDEGFGSLDKESLRIVFETLKSLRKENRIVGIISHVEELQQEIDLFLTVENNKERGSLIGYSWKG